MIELTPEALIQAALQEDIREGDHTTLACVPANARQQARLVAKETGIIAGIDIVKEVYRQVDEQLQLIIHAGDGTIVHPGDVVMTLDGSAQSILTGERLMLNYLQRMSGVATLTRRFVEACQSYPAKILDTRKTTPLMRRFEKLAVKIGGGENHRFGLYDMVMIKDNHIAYAGGITQAIETVLQYLQKNTLNLRIEIETTNTREIEEVLKVGQVHRIMLDNFTPEAAKAAVELIDGRYETEISGGVNLSTVRAYAASGADFISVGALTHSTKSLDLSLQAV